MATAKLGTILPTAKSELINARYAQNVAIMKQRVAVEMGLTKLRTTYKYGETQYWETDKIYSIVGRDGKVKRFEFRSDGYDYAI